MGISRKKIERLIIQAGFHPMFATDNKRNYEYWFLSSISHEGLMIPVVEFFCYLDEASYPYKSPVEYVSHVTNHSYIDLMGVNEKYIQNLFQLIIEIRTRKLTRELLIEKYTG